MVGQKGHVLSLQYSADDWQRQDLKEPKAAMQRALILVSELR